jgi:hypothetical protein
MQSLQVLSTTDYAYLTDFNNKKTNLYKSVKSVDNILPFPSLPLLSCENSLNYATKIRELGTTAQNQKNVYVAGARLALVPKGA